MADLLVRYFEAATAAEVSSMLVVNYDGVRQLLPRDPTVRSSNKDPGRNNRVAEYISKVSVG